MENKNSKKIIITLVAIMAIILIVVLGYFVMIKLEQNKVENKIEEIFNNLKSNEDNSAKQEVLDEIKSNAELEDTENNAIDYVVLLDKLNYSIVKNEVNFNDAKVVLDVTNKNMKKILGNYLVKAFNLAMANVFSPTYSEEETNEVLANYIKELVDSDEIENVTTQVTLYMKKIDGEWIIKDDSKKELLRAILPGFVEAVNEMNNSFDESAE